MLLRNRSFLTAGVTTREDEPTYRVHDLMHVMARSLIEEGVLESATQTVNDVSQNFVLAHRQFLGRYRECAIDRHWDKLPNDRYIYRHLTWHMEQANWADEIHALMATSDEHGRNAWFEACNRIGQPGIFVDDVARGWRLAEEMYEQDSERAIILQVRYALISATQKSFSIRVSPELLSTLVKHDIWSVERAWMFIESTEDWQQASALAALTPYLPESLLKKAVEMTENMTNAEDQAGCWVSLAKLQPELVSKACDAIEKIQGIQKGSSKRANLLSDLSENYQNLFDKALEQAENIPDDYLKAVVLIRMLPRKSELLEEILQLAKELTQGDYDSLSSAEQKLCKDNQAFLYSKIINYKPDFLNTSLIAARQTQYHATRANILTNLVQHDKTLLDETLISIKTVHGGYLKSIFLKKLATKYDLKFLPDALAAAKQIEDEFEQALLLIGLIEWKPELLDDAVKKSRQVQDAYQRAFSLTKLVPWTAEIFDEALAVAREIEDEHMRAAVLIDLSEQTKSSTQKIELLEEALDAATNSQWEHRKGHILRDLSKQKLPQSLFERTIQLARSVQDPVEKAKTLIELSQHDSLIIEEVFELITSIRNEYKLISEQNEDFLQTQYEHFLLIFSLSKQSDELFSEGQELMQEIKSPPYRALALCELAKIKPDLCEQALEAVKQIQSPFTQADALGSLVRHCPDSLLPNIFDAIDSITSPYYRAEVYSSVLDFFPGEEIALNEWSFLLHLLASRKRSDLMEDLATLHPAIINLGSESAMCGVVSAMHEVCSQWK